MNTEKPYILHAISPTKFVSPFDVNMAYDSGFDKVSTYTNVEMDDINDLVQDIVFSRHPNDCKKTGLFIAGEDDEKAIEMMEKAKKAMVPPFEISIFADPAGSFTTAAAMIGCVKKLLKEKFKTDLKDKVLQIVGAKGIVGGACAVIAAQEGAKVGMVIHREGAIEPIEKRIKNYKKKYKVNLNAIMGISDDEKTKMSENADIILCTAKAGAEALLKKHFSSAKNLKIVSELVSILRIEDYKYLKKKTPISGKLIIFTGTFVNNSRSELKSLAESMGAKIVSTISKKTDYLVAGSQRPTVRKINEAKHLNIKVLTEDDWNKIINL